MRLGLGNGAFSGLVLSSPPREMCAGRDEMAGGSRHSLPVVFARDAANTDNPVPCGHQSSAETGGLDELAKRISISPVLREHQVWAAIPLLEPMTGLRGDSMDFRVFTALMDRDALLEALLFLAGRLAPVIEFSRLVRSHGVWLCRAKVMCTDQTGERTQRCFRAVHADAPAAMLLAILIAANPAWSSAR
ncbi:hypothetical protein [Rhizobium sp. SL42]|uniref:hypothetical protein n=1 Tax=Rhizobium sp. SL42 TaxID=2806346 RepID=UPI001F1E85E0|nr:hypothetical protein [Rhizobium sp. SL42]UJW76214.1 hypothetical protein IM739_06945 [Rhizobium sp. SL42]